MYKPVCMEKHGFAILSLSSVKEDYCFRIYMYHMSALNSEVNDIYLLTNRISYYSFDWSKINRS